MYTRVRHYYIATRTYLHLKRDEKTFLLLFLLLGYLFLFLCICNNKIKDTKLIVMMVNNGHDKVHLIYVCFGSSLPAFTLDNKFVYLFVFFVFI